MNFEKLFLFSFGIIGIIYISSRKTKFLGNPSRNNIKNNLSKELEMIDDKEINSNEIDIDDLLNEHGFLKEKYNNLKDNDKINYSLIHGYL